MWEEETFSTFIRDMRCAIFFNPAYLNNPKLCCPCVGTDPQYSQLCHGDVEEETLLEDDGGGLKINYHKNTLVPINMSPQEINDTTNILNCPVGSMPCSYLGLPLSTTKISHNMLTPVIAKIDKRLAGWLGETDNDKLSAFCNTHLLYVMLQMARKINRGN